MTPTRYRQCLDLLGIGGSRQVAALLDCDDRLVRRWGNGDVPIPAEVAEWLERAAAVWVDRPQPQRGWYQQPAA